jgi:hypothetical protein
MDLGLNGKVGAAIGRSVGIGLAIAELLTSSDADYLSPKRSTWMAATG